MKSDVGMRRSQLNDLSTELSVLVLQFFDGLVLLKLKLDVVLLKLFDLALIFLCFLFIVKLD